MKTALRTLGAMIALATVLAIWAWNSHSAQDWLLEKVVTAGMQRPPPMDTYVGLKVFLCGTSSPLPGPGRAQACVIILAGSSLYLIDAGAGSAQVAAINRLPLERLEAAFLTHFHSDHIAALPEFNLNSWVAGRPEPLIVFGPEGVTEVIAGLNSAYRLDRTYRVDHHGTDLLSPDLGVMQSELLEPGASYERGNLTVTSFRVNHDPVNPAVGYRFDYLGRSVVISGDTIVSPGLIEASTGADLLLQDSLSLPIIKSFEKASAGSRMAKIFLDIQDYHAHTSEFSALVEHTGVRQLALYHLIPAPQNILFEKIFMRDVPPGTVLTQDAMVFELPANSNAITKIDP